MILYRQNSCVNLVDKNYIFTLIIINTFYKSTECSGEVRFHWGMSVTKQQLLVTGLRMSKLFAPEDKANTFILLIICGPEVFLMFNHSSSIQLHSNHWCSFCFVIQFSLKITAATLPTGCGCVNILQTYFSGYISSRSDLEMW